MNFRSDAPLPRSISAIAIGRAISFLGDEVALLAMAFRAKAQLGHLGVAAVLIAGTIPFLLLAPVAGLLVDRLRARPLLVGVTLSQAAVCVALAWSSHVLLFPLIVLLACGTVLINPAWSALVPTLVSDEQLPAAMGMLQSANAIAGIAGPFVGGVLVAAYGFHVPLLVDGASFLLIAALPLLLRVDRVPPRAIDGGFSVRESLMGVKLIAQRPVLRSLVILAVLFVLALGVINIVEIFFITTALHAGPRGYGFLGLCTGVGMLVTSLCSGWLAARFPRPERLLVTGCVGLSFSLLALSLTNELWQAVVVVILVGAFNALLNVNAMVLITRNSTDEIRGRLFSAIQGLISAAQIGSVALGGLLLIDFAPRSLIFVAALVSAVTLTVTVRPVVRASRANDIEPVELSAP